MRCLITGGNGFVGRALTSHVLASGCEVRLSLRQPPRADQIAGVETVEIGSLSLKNDWTAALRDIDKIVHLAARAHVMNDKSLDPLAEFRRVNVEGTANLARQAAAAGVRRFVYLSSIKVNGEFTEVGHPFTADDAPAPEDPYGVSKYEAEQLLRQIGTTWQHRYKILQRSGCSLTTTTVQTWPWAGSLLNSGWPWLRNGSTSAPPVKGEDYPDCREM